MSAAKPATSLPVNRHFDCMKRCPMDCAKACKRLAYPRIVAELRMTAGHDNGDGTITLEDDGNTPQNRARALLTELGESK